MNLGARIIVTHHSKRTFLSATRRMREGTAKFDAKCAVHTGFAKSHCCWGVRVGIWTHNLVANRPKTAGNFFFGPRVVQFAGVVHTILAIWAILGARTWVRVSASVLHTRGTMHTGADVLPVC